MKNLKLNFAVLALALGFGIAFTQSAFTPIKQRVHHRADVQYQFNGTVLAQDKTASEYSVVSGTPPSCNEADVLPCIITVPDGETLDQWLGERSSSDILADADDTRN